MQFLFPGPLHASGQLIVAMVVMVMQTVDAVRVSAGPRAHIVHSGGTGPSRERRREVGRLEVGGRQSGGTASTTPAATTAGRRAERRAHLTGETVLQQIKKQQKIVDSIFYSLNYTLKL